MTGLPLTGSAWSWLEGHGGRCPVCDRSRSGSARECEDAPVTAVADENRLRTDVVAALRSAVRGAVDDSSRRRAEYSTDASNYRVVPEVVVFPRDRDDVLAALAVTREAGVPLTARGAGTSVAGNSIGPGVVLDFSRHVNRILEIDPEARTARVEPGVIMASLQRAAAPTVCGSGRTRPRGPARRSAG